MNAWNHSRQWRTQVVECLAELADLDYQRRAWRGEIVGEIHSFEECVAMLYNDTNLSKDLVEGQVFSTDIDEELRSLEMLVGAVNPIRPVDDILDDPALLAVRKTAARARALLLSRSS